jgi:DNA gyrase/topoisomerase IV subunit B
MRPEMTSTPSATLSTVNSDRRDLTLDVVRALVLYSLAEFQSGHANTIRVTVEGTSFSVADDGRGHAIERTVAEAPYLKFVYTHLDYPFGASQGAPVQLQGIGMSLINSLCSEMTVTARKPEVTLRLGFREGQLCDSRRVDVKAEEAGNTVAGTIDPQLQKTGVALSRVHSWLIDVLSVSPALKLFLNGHELLARRERDATHPRR